MGHNKTNSQHWRNGLNKLTSQFSSKDGSKQKLGEVPTQTLAGYCVAEPSAESGGSVCRCCLLTFVFNMIYLVCVWRSGVWRSGVHTCCGVPVRGRGRIYGGQLCPSHCEFWRWDYLSCHAWS